MSKNPMARWVIHRLGGAQRPLYAPSGVCAVQEGRAEGVWFGRWWVGGGWVQVHMGRESGTAARGAQLLGRGISNPRVRSVSRQGTGRGGQGRAGEQVQSGGTARVWSGQGAVKRAQAVQRDEREAGQLACGTRQPAPVEQGQPAAGARSCEQGAAGCC